MRTSRFAKFWSFSLLLTLLGVLFAGLAPAQAANISLTVTSSFYQRPDGLNRYHKSLTYIGAVEANGRFVASELADLGINAYRLYVGMERLESADDNGVYGSPDIPTIKANPNMIPWTTWDTAFRTPNTYAWAGGGPAISFEDLIIALRQNGIEPIICVRLQDNYGHPTWISKVPATQADYNEWWEYVYAVAYWLNVRNNYGITHWEILNEPNGSDYGGGLDNYAVVLDNAYDALHTVNDARGLPTYVMAPSPSDHDPGWVGSMLLRRDAEIDIADYHEHATAQDAYNRNIWPNVLNNNLDGIIEPLWNGEWGNSLKGFNTLSLALDVAQGIYEQSISDVYGSTLFSMYPYVASGGGRGWPGLIHPDGVKEEGYWAMRLIIRGLQNGKMLYQVQTSDTTSMYLAAKDATNLNLIVINRSGTTNTLTANVSAHLSTGTATVYEYSSARKDVVAVTPAISGGSVTFTSPSNSVVLVVMPLSGTPAPTNTPTSTVPPTNTPTNTPVLPTNTPTDTPSGPTNTPTATSASPSNTPTWTSTPTSTPTRTNTPAPTATPGGGISFVQTVGSASCGATTNVITVPAGGVLAGHTLIARSTLRSSSAATGSFSVSDSKGNTYTLDLDFTESTGHERVALFHAYVSAALAAGDTITGNFPNVNGTTGLVVSEFAGLSATSPVDVSAAAGGNSAAPSVSATTTNASDLVYAVVGMWNSPAYTEATGWTTDSHLATACGGAGGSSTNHGAYKIVSTTGTYTYNPTLGSSNYWVDEIVAYK